MYKIKMIVKERKFQNILAANPSFIAEILDVNTNSIQVLSVEFSYASKIKNVSSRFDLIVRIYTDMDNYKDVYLELKTLDSSCSLSQIQKYYNIITYDKYHELADCPREFHFLVLENEFGYPHLKSYLSNFNIANHTNLTLYTVSQQMFVSYLEQSGEEFDMDILKEEYKIEEINLEKVNQFIDGDINETYLLNFINYLAPAYGAENSGKRYQNTAEYFYKVFGLTCTIFNHYKEIKIGENTIKNRGNNRSINFRDDKRTILALFANTYPLQIKLYLKNDFDKGMQILNDAFSSIFELTYKENKGNYEWWDNDSRLIMKAYPRYGKKQIFIPLDKFYEDDLKKVKMILEIINQVFSKIKDW
jgi:hypothetical protein